MDTDENLVICRELSGCAGDWQNAVSAHKCGDLFMVEDREALILPVFPCPSRPLLEASLLMGRPPAPFPLQLRQLVAIGFFWFKMLYRFVFQSS